MSITITDVTAGELVLTIDNSGQMCFGNGAPIDMLTLNGYGIIDDEGIIVNGIGSAALSFTTGSGTLSYEGNIQGYATDVAITTLSGKIPTVQLDSSYPCWTATRSESGIVTNTSQPLPTMRINALGESSFIIQNFSESITPPAYPSGPIPEGSQNYVYRWL